MTIASGARTIPEGGYYAIGKVNVPGALVVGDGAGFVNMEKIKGIHNAMWSGMAAAETIAAGLAQAEGGEIALKGYQDRLEASGVLPEMRHARNYRQAFRWGLYVGAPLVADRAPAADAAGHGGRPRGHQRRGSPRPR